MKRTFVEIANSYSGITGKKIPNNYGDKKFGYYHFFGRTVPVISLLHFKSGLNISSIEFIGNFYGLWYVGFNHSMKHA